MKLIYTCVLGLLVACTSSTKPETPKHVKPVKLEFYESYSYSQLATNWQHAIAYSEQTDSSGLDGNTALTEIKKGSLGKLLAFDGASSSLVEEQNRSQVDSILAIPEIKKMFPGDVQFVYSYAPTIIDGKKTFSLYTIREIYPVKDRITGKDFKTVKKSLNDITNQYVISIEMAYPASEKFKNLTKNNVGKGLAILIDGKVLSCPIVQHPISDGKVEISGNFTQEEVDNMVMALQAGR